MVKCAKVCSWLTIGIGLVMVVVGVVFISKVFPDILEKQIEQGLLLENGTEAADRFQSSPVPVYFSFYFFNVTNKNAVNIYIDTVPLLQQLGPYVFREEKTKEISAWDKENGTVRYRERTIYYFEPDMTTGNLSDVVNHVNAVSVALKYKFQDIPFFGDFLVKTIRGLFIETHSVEEMIFKGFNIQSYFPISIAFLCKTVLKENCTFGFYLGKNNSLSEEYEVSTGTFNIQDYTKIKKYAKEEELPYWYGPTCNALNGTDGLQFPPGVTKDSQPYVFSSDVCRSLMFQYDEDTTVEDIPAYRFVVPASVFADPNKDKDNMCFCHKDPNIPCPSKAGVVPLVTCQKEPVMVSAPHFYQGQPEYWQSFGGLNPEKEKHQSFLDIEPLTGAVISAAKRIQISILLEPDKRLPCIKGLKDLWYFPAFWAEEGGRIDQKNAADFRSRVLTPYRIGKWSLVSAIIVGGLLFLVATVLVILKKCGARIPYTSLKVEVNEEETPAAENS